MRLASASSSVVGLCVLLLPLTETVVLRGVAPADESKYDGESFKCRDQKTEVPSAAVNDDFCDCPDGSDEPGTAACAGIGSESTQPWFFCPNSVSAARYLYPSQVGDGVCDCCDGSDEWQHGWCKDDCEEQGRKHREKMEMMRESAKRGIEKRKQAIADMREAAEESKVRLAELRSSIPQLEARHADLRTKWHSASEAVTAQAGTETEKASVDDSKPEGPAVSEYAKWMEKGGVEGDTASADLPVGTGDIERQTSERKEIDVIKVMSGDLVDFVDFVYKDGSTLSTGDGKGNEQEPFRLQPGERVVEIRGGQGGLLDSIQFVTDTGRESARYGGDGGEKFRVTATPGKMIVGLDRAEGIAGKVRAVLECDFEDRRTPEEKARDEAKYAVDLAHDELEKAKREVNDLKVKLEGDFTDSTAAYSLFEEKCGKASFGQYNYEICLFGEAKQDYTTLGRWKAWGSSNVGIFDNGDHCFSGRERSLKVFVQCGENTEILQVREPSQCFYEASMSHPAACDPKSFEVSTSGVIMPNEAHEEL